MGEQRVGQRSEILDSGAALRMSGAGGVSSVADADENVPALSASTIHDVAQLMTLLCNVAMKEHHSPVVVNPVADLELPKIEPGRSSSTNMKRQRRSTPPVQYLSGPGWRPVFTAPEEVR